MRSKVKVEAAGERKRDRDKEGEKETKTEMERKAERETELVCMTLINSITIINITLATWSPGHAHTLLDLIPQHMLTFNTIQRMHTT